jgi:hypothetical protein
MFTRPRASGLIPGAAAAGDVLAEEAEVGLEAIGASAHKPVLWTALLHVDAFERY